MDYILAIKYVKYYIIFSSSRYFMYAYTVHLHTEHNVYTIYIHFFINKSLMYTKTAFRKYTKNINFAKYFCNLK